jgi:hypothetical protein
MANIYGEFISKRNKAACDSLLTVPYNKRSSINKRLTAEEIVQQMDKGNVCKACIRIVIVERLNGVRPKQKPKPISVDFTANIESLSKMMAAMGVTMETAGGRMQRMAEIVGPILAEGCKITPPIISIPKDFSFRGSKTFRSTSQDHIDSIVGLIGEVTA